MDDGLSSRCPTLCAGGVRSRASRAFTSAPASTSAVMMSGVGVARGRFVQGRDSSPIACVNVRAGRQEYGQHIGVFRVPRRPVQGCAVSVVPCADVRVGFEAEGDVFGGGGLEEAAEVARIPVIAVGRVGLGGSAVLGSHGKRGQKKERRGHCQRCNSRHHCLRITNGSLAWGSLSSGIHPESLPYVDRSWRSDNWSMIPHHPDPLYRLTISSPCSASLFLARSRGVLPSSSGTVGSAPEFQ